MKKDLSTVNSLTRFMYIHRNELWKKLSDKTIDADSLICFFEHGIKEENISIKNETEKKFINNIKKLKKDKSKLIVFITNTMLKGMCLGL